MKPAKHLLHCSGNAQADFSQFVTGIVSDGASDKEDEKLSSPQCSFDKGPGNADVSTELFDGDAPPAIPVCFYIFPSKIWH